MELSALKSGLTYLEKSNALLLHTIDAMPFNSAHIYAEYLEN